MKTASKLLFWLTLLSAFYLLAYPQRQPVAGAASQTETQYEQDGEHRRGWPLTYLTYVSEHGDSKSTYYDFKYNYQPIKPISLAVNIAIFAIALLALFGYPEISSKQLWITTATFFVIVFLISLLITGTFNEQNLNTFNVRILGPDRAIHFAIFTVLITALFFVISRLVVMFGSFTQKTEAGNSNIAR